MKSSPLLPLFQHCTYSSPHTAATLPDVSQPVPFDGPQVAALEQRAITTPTWLAPLGIETETGPPVQPVTFTPLSSWLVPAVRSCRPRTAFPLPSLMKIAPTSNGLTSRTASGSEPPSDAICRIETRACATVAGTSCFANNQGRFVSAAFTSM